MMNYLWCAMIVIGIVYAAITGNLTGMADAAIESAQSAVTLCITMVGIMSLWVGLMEIAREGGLVEQLSRLISPVLTFLFPEVPAKSKAREYIALNVIANVLGLGWAATPAGLEAMKELELLRAEQKEPAGVATNAMCNFLILNISSLQLIPVSIIAYRTQYGSKQPTSIIAPAIIATLLSTLAAVLFIRIMNRWKGARRRK